MFNLWNLKTNKQNVGGKCDWGTDIRPLQNSRGRNVKENECPYTEYVTLTYRDAVVHDGGVLIRDLHLVHFARGVLVEPDAHVRLHVVVHDLDELVPVGQLVLVHQADRVADLVQIQAFLLAGKYA